MVDSDPTSFSLQASGQSGPSIDRLVSLDVVRGLILVIMAVGHAGLFWSENRDEQWFDGGGVVGAQFAGYRSWHEQVVWQIGHICLPGFHFMAGMSLAISVERRKRRGRPGWVTSRDIAVRGLMLCGLEALVSWIAGAPFCFFVLSSLGACMIIFAAVRVCGSSFILAASTLVLLAAPLYAPSQVQEPSAGHYLINVLVGVAIEPGLRTAFLVYFPILPWIFCFGVGWYVGQCYAASPDARFRGLPFVGLGFVLLGFGLRLFGGSYGDSLPIGEGPSSSIFWAVTKFPPSPVYLLVTIGMMGVILGLTRFLDFREPASCWRVLVVYGRVPLFLYLTHSLLFPLYPTLTDTSNQYGAATAWVVGVVGVALLYWPCVKYNQLRMRYNRVLRYF